MSLLMQALKKAERARQSGLQEEEFLEEGQPPHDTPAADPAVAASDPAAREPKAPSSPLELSLEPLDDRPDPPARAEQPPPPPPPPPRPPIQPAVEAAHNPVPPQARHEGARARPATDEVPLGDARAAPRPGAAQPGRRGPGAPERRTVPRTAAATGDTGSGVDVARLRVAGLGVLLVVVAGTFGYLYWQGVSGPGPGASLPMVPMPPPSATGATGAAGPGGEAGIVVAPASPPFGPAAPAAAPYAPPPAAAPTDVSPAAVPSGAAQSNAPVAQAPAAAPPAQAPASAVPRTARQQAAPRSGRAPGPTAAQLASIEDPEMRDEAMRVMMERAERESRNEGYGTTPSSPGGGIAGGGPLADAAPATAAAEAGSADVRVARGSAAPAISPAVQAGYAAFGSGDLATARQQYGAALRSDPNNRDALLGSAAVALRERRDDEAAGYYARLLAVNPRDAEAVAGLAALRPGDGDRAEIRLKGVLRNNPEAAPVHFTLGNLYARQGRWQEAQQAYFRAWSAAPANADYAFNLAVGLDRLNQGRLAREYYQRALALASAGGAAFDRMAVQRRLQELAPAPAAAPAPAPAAAPAEN